MSKKKSKISTNSPNPSLRLFSTNHKNKEVNFNQSSEQVLLSFFQRNGIYILPALILLIASFLYSDFLFGKNVFLFKDIGSDSYNFDYPKLYNLADHWEKYGSPSWSFEQGLGQNMHPYWFDPFTFLLVIAGKQSVANNLIYVFLLELLLAGMLFYLFLR